ncbi:MAG: hypothetical protein ABEI98_10160 [Halorhabdus sp.]
MSYRDLSGWFSMTSIDSSIAKVGVVVSVLLLGLRLYASQPLLLVIPLATGTGSMIYLLVETRTATPVRPNLVAVGTPTLPRTVVGYLPAAVVAGLAAYVLAVHHYGARTDAVYLVIAAVATGVFVQILFGAEDRTPLVLVQLVVVALVLRLAPLAVTPGFVGVDIWTHATVFVDGIARTGSLAPLADSKYFMAPLYHAVSAVGTLVFGTSRAGIYLTLGVLLPLSLLFVYGTGRLLVSARWALLATALFAFAEQFIRWGMHLIPTSLGLVFFLVVVYAVTRLLAVGVDRWVLALLAVASLATVFTHQVSTAILLVFLGIATLSTAVTTVTAGRQHAPSRRQTLALVGVFVSTLATTVASWSVTPFANGTFLWQELAVLQTRIAESAGFLNLVSESAAESIGGPAKSGLVSTLVPYVELVGFGLLLAAAVLGGLALLRRHDAPALTATHVLTAAGLFVLVFGLSLFGVHALLPGRWLAFLYVSLSLLGAFGLYLISRQAPRRVVVAVFVLIAVGYPATMVVAEKATLDQPAFDDQYKRFAYSEAEIAAVESIGALYSPAEGTIATDHPYVTLFRRYGSYERASILGLGRDVPDATGGAVYRSYQSTGPVTFHRAATAPVETMPADVQAAVCPPEWNVGYANDVVRLAFPASGGTQ